MIKMSLRDFKARCGEHRAIAALAVTVDDEAIGKKRMIHDASHEVRGMRCRDKSKLLQEMMEAKQVAFSVVGDISKAHQRFKHREEEHGYLRCQIDALPLAIGGRRFRQAGIRATHHSLAGSGVHAGPATLCR